MDYFRFAPLEDANHIKANLLEVRLLFGEVLFGDEAEFSLLCRRNRFDRLSEGRASPELHFTEDEGSAVAEDKVCLAVASLEIPLDEGISEAFEKRERDVFAAFAVGAPPFQLPTPA